jgi:single-strand DNA-binding protein
MNLVALSGRICKELEAKYSSTGTAVMNFTLAVDRQTKEKTTDFINCIAFNKTAELMGQYCTKGQKIIIEGSIQVRSWDDKDGKKHYSTEVIANRVEFCEGKKQDKQERQSSQIDDSSEDSLPF